jgi:hypothetical protein
MTPKRPMNCPERDICNCRNDARLCIFAGDLAPEPSTGLEPVTPLKEPADSGRGTTRRATG